MAKYFRISAGKNAKYLNEALEGNWIGVDWLANHDLTGKFPENWRDFNVKWVDVICEENETNRIAAGLGAAGTWTTCFGVKTGDLVLVPTGQSTYRVAKVNGDYYYAKGQPLPHRRSVIWLDREIRRDELSEELKSPMKSLATTVNLGEVPELDLLLAGEILPGIQAVDPEIENPLSFVLEQHLEDFLVSNWAHTELAKKYDIYTDEEGQQAGQQFQTDTGRIDILAQSKDGKELLVIELKRGRVSDVVVGQILRYMGFVNELDATKKVKGIIIGTDDDDRFRRAISMVPDLEFYKYEVTFKLKKA